jgi:hypothetical protein
MRKKKKLIGGMLSGNGYKWAAAIGGIRLMMEA